MKLRVHQQRALAALGEAWDAGRTRAWVVLPPGAGKTLVGLETARDAIADGAKVVVLSPNTAIQGQWLRQAASLGLEASSSRDLHAPLTSLTYQSVAVFGDPDDEAETGESHLARLHDNGRALVSALRTAGPLLLVLDECHHLLEVWGELLGEILLLLPDARVLGLTATPPEALTKEESALVGLLFGEIVFSTSIPAVVREGDLAPFADLVWLTAPTPSERDWLRGSAERFEELLTALTSADLGSVPFLAWLDRRFVSRAEGAPSWAELAKAMPDVTTAALRAHHRGLLALPEGATLTEAHRRDPSAEDWVALIGDWVRGHLTSSESEADQEALAAIKQALPAVGYSLTRRGIRAGRSPVDRVLARSETKTTATAAIVDHERLAHGDSLRLLVVTDHERASATLPVDLRGVIAEQSGSARAVLATLCRDHDDVLLVTGATVAGPPATLAALLAHIAEADPVLAEGLAVEKEEAYATLVGRWGSRQWVGHVTRFFEAGGCRILVGTRGLLGEGWDARSVTGIVDLTAATTTTAVVQLRGRSLRTDPGRPDKVAVNWTVVCVEEEHPRGDNDWKRLVRKHTGFFGADEDGSVVDGVGHIDESFSPYAAPPESGFDTVNARMVARSEDRTAIRERWRIGEPYADIAGRTVRIRLRRAGVLRMPSGAVLAPRPPAFRLLEGRVPEWHLPAKAVLAPAALLSIGLVLALAFGAAGGIAGAVGGLVGGLWALWVAYVYRDGTRIASQLRRRPTVGAVGAAVADALNTTGQTSVGAAGLEIAVDTDGSYRLHLAGVPEEESALFAASLEEALAPIAAPRYLVARPVVGDLDALERLRLGVSGRHAANAEAWHAVPVALGRRAADAKAFHAAWEHWVGGSGLLYTGSPEGAGVLTAQRGTDPFDVTAVIRRHWS
ncbi:Type III restriction enzyme, res subunit [Nocardioides sp. YR527]|uniref:DEAD/DEAH box helicase family protein n=1 Tax=Nocardioides sp. YR527 TaxID=1881028 RepID=UPI000891217A|nr:DEAD/DEAH box helicase family protein [Nocardioides sp. YR527]SDL16645.1 Type III restriction enzyme, res subunit [Nocardioides sp. YR527]